ncbi:MAG TPA: DUF5777 family beta-barrel protein [Thermoanaerobaculia bacterium]|nr:DUF5777 family beta-barrel protein [Thermoanaerobaculia bacterium]
MKNEESESVAPTASQFLILHSKFLILFLLIATSALAQEDQYKPLPKLPTGDWFLSLPSCHMPAKGTWEIRFSHRFNQSLAQGGFSDQLHSLFGLDSNADVVFGASYAVRPDLQLSLHRSNTNDTLEAAAKFVVLQQAPAVPVSLSLRGGADVRTERDLEDRTSFFAQAIVSRQLGKRVEVFLLPTFVTDAGRAVTGDSSGALFSRAFNVPFGIVLLLRPGVSAIAEITPPNRDLPDEMNADLGWAVGIKRQIGGHWFEILFTNSQAAFADQYTTSTFQGTALDAGNIHLGFNIERRFGRRRR